LSPAAVFTADDGVLHPGWVVLVEGERIAAVGPADKVTAPADAERVTLPRMTLLPGFMDLHSHLFLHPYDETLWNDQVLKEPEAYRTIEAVKHADATLMAGFTILRDLGTEGAGYADLSLKRAIQEGLIPGPRLWVATRAIVASGCYGPGPKGFRDDLVLPQGGQAASGIPAILEAVREQAGHGADWIKVYADYRCGPDGSTVPTFTQEELNALVEAAHSLGRPVSAHATTAEGMRRGAGRGQHHRAWLRRHAGGIQAHGGAPRGLSADAHSAGGLLPVLPGLRARQDRAQRRYAASAPSAQLRPKSGRDRGLR
jgi:imidazolonepropionase-like amidohydrolase